MSKLTKLYRAATATQVALENRQAAALAAETALQEVAVESYNDAEQTQEVAPLISAVARAEDARDVVHEVRQVEDAVMEIRDVADTVNQAGGITLESFTFATMALEQQTRRLGVPMPSFGFGLESFTDKAQRQLLSLEGIDELITTIKSGGVELEKQSVDAVVAVYDALKDSLPAAKARLDNLCVQLKDAKSVDGGMVDVSDGISKMLGVDGKLPDDFAGFFTQYAAYGKALTTEYNESAIDAATRAAKFDGCLDFTDAGTFWESAGKEVDAIGDPRKKLTDDQMNFVLPGCSPLFGGVVSDIEGDNSVIKAMRVFTESRAPLDPSDDSDEEAAAAAADEEVNTPEEVDTELDDAAAADADADLAQATDAADTESETAVADSADDIADTNGTADDALDAGELDAELPTVESLDEETSAPALTVTAIEGACKALCDLHECLALGNLVDRGKATWSDTQNAVRQTRTAVDNAPETVQAEIRDDVDTVTDYLDTVHTLSAWPVVHFLTNLVLSTNAFVLYAQRSLNAEGGETTDAAPEVVEEVVETTPAEPETTETTDEPAADITTDTVVGTDPEIVMSPTDGSEV